MSFFARKTSEKDKHRLWDQYYKSVPISRLWPLYAAVFCLFAITGIFGDIFNLGHTPYVITILNAIFSGSVALMYIHVGMRLTPRYFIHATLLQIPIWLGFTAIVTFLGSHFHLQPVPAASGVRFAGVVMLLLVIVSYSLLIRFVRGEGQESSRIRNELELAHGIQKTLVPPVALRDAQFELYGRSDPSDKVGGDLVDALRLEDGSTVAYIADIAGHGLQAGILMGMLKTAARTALLDARLVEPQDVLPSLMDRLNRVLPDVKEPQMYATFAGFRLNPDGSVFYALAAHPPILHYRSRAGTEHISAEQFPLGLMPVEGFSAGASIMLAGDLLIAVTDGILEASNESEDEFGLDRLQEVIARHSGDSLPVLADAILGAARAFGKQIDDQTLLLVRRL
ncbi:PP2C family protein-serine/threonine phosphatase [Alloacidobacterium sp.]|uniref:PP2C family protein-serine/threonine phosphatase n=1 Tax=Alloacidobacterium sp. TaxID=2951999 RepID=UPI002D573613|nr:PP2C family protein-serine/threonine phosphatase [Alloacidobacterium sp.]HYK36021.1 PP2C family protein-serine/threonine phosphatase [Alloacidobacterium sp.]